MKKAKCLFLCFLFLLLNACSHTFVWESGQSRPDSPPPAQQTMHSPESSPPERETQAEHLFEEGYIDPIDAELPPDLKRLLASDRESVHSLLGRDYHFFAAQESYLQQGLSFRYNEMTGPSLIEADRVGRPTYILLTPQYKLSFSKGVTLDDTVQDIINLWGTPQYIDDEMGLCGYKLRDCYIFLTGHDALEEVAIYPRSEEQGGPLMQEIEARLGVISEDNFSSWMDYLYKNVPNYTYCYSGGFGGTTRRVGSGMAYLDIGLVLHNVNEGPPFLTLYGNNGIEQTLSDEAKESISFLPQEDSVFSYEKERREKKELLRQRVANEGIVSADKTKAVLVSDEEGIRHLSGLYLISLDNQFEDREIVLGDMPTDFRWLNDRYVLYCGFDYYVCDTEKSTFERIYTPNSKADVSVALMHPNIILFSFADDSDEIVTTRVQYDVGVNGEIHWEEIGGRLKFQLPPRRGLLVSGGACSFYPPGSSARALAAIQRRRVGRGHGADSPRFKSSLPYSPRPLREAMQS